MRLIKSTVIALTILFLASCARTSGSVDDFSQSLYTPEEASGFEILGAEGRESILIRSRAPWQGATDETRELLVLRDGESAPAGYDGPIVSDTISRIVCLSSGHMAMLSLLGECDAIVGGSGLDYITSPEINSRRGELTEIGYEGAFDYEALVAAKPDLVTIYGVNSANPIEAKLKELGIPYIYVGDYLEESPLGKAEWIVALGECLGKRQEAISQYRHISDNYQAVKHRLDSISASERPKVMLNSPYGDSWFLPPAGSYMARLVTDAGGEYLGSGIKGNSSKAISMEEAASMVAKADRWINIGSDVASIADLRRRYPVVANSGVVSRGALFTNTLRSTPAGGNDFYESGIVNPDLILRDIIKILYPHLVSEAFNYYMPLPQSAPATVVDEADSDGEQAE